MNIDNQVIETLEELEAFLHLIESGALGLEGVTRCGTCDNEHRWSSICGSIG